MGSTDENSKHLSQKDTLVKEDVSNSDNKEWHPEHNEALDHERELYQDLAGALPLGIYRLRVYHDAGTKEDRWNSKDNPPYKIEFVNDRLFKILGIDKAAFIMNPGIINNYIFEADKPEFVRKNIEANTYTTSFVWEGRLTGNGHLIWVHFESIPRVLENNDILWTGFFRISVNEKEQKKNFIKRTKSYISLMLRRINFSLSLPMT